MIGRIKFGKRVIVKQLDGTQIVFESFKRQEESSDKVFKLFGR